MKNFKKFFIASSLVIAPVISQANPGCGLGSQVFDGEEGLFAHLLAVTTNGTSGNQTFGMTSGTLGCDTTEPVTAAALFINENMEEVAENISTGEGESLTTLAELLNIENREDFASTLQQNFSNIYTSESVTAEEVIFNITKTLEQAS